MLLKHHELTELLTLTWIFVSIVILRELIWWIPYFYCTVYRTRVEFSFMSWACREQLIYCFLMSFKLIYTNTFIEIPKFNKAIAPCSRNINAFNSNCCHTRYAFLVCLIIIAFEFEFTRMLLIPNSKSFPTSTN